MRASPGRVATALAVGLMSVSVAPPRASAGETPLRAAPQTVQLPMHNPDECYCRAQGRTFAIGESTCLYTPDGMRLAQCGMVLNNTSWHVSQRACPES